jgi:hypothetical protein
MAEAYAYASGAGPRPYELELLYSLDRYGGAQNVLGRVLGAGEMRRMNTADSIVRWHSEKFGGDNWTKWAQDNPAQNDALGTAARLADEMGLLKDTQ